MELDKNLVVLVTGCTSGIGYQATLCLINNGNKVIALCRSESRVKDLKKQLENDNITSKILSNLLSTYIVDLSDLFSIDAFADTFLKNKLNVDTFVFNAGLQYTGSKLVRRSAQNIELTFAVNHLSHQLLIQRLLPRLLSSKSPRIVITSSEVHNPESPGGRIGKIAGLGQLKGLQMSYDFKMVDGFNDFDADKAYKDSKLCNILFAKELSRRLTEKGNNIPIICWAPGLVIPRSKEGFFRYSRKYNELGQLVFAFFARDLFRITESPERAGKILMNLAVSNKYLKERFIFISNRIKRPGKMVFREDNVSEEAMDQIKAKKLWDLCNSILKKFINKTLF